MARYNEVLVGRFNRFVQKHFSMKGQVALPTVAGDIGMTMQFNNGSENRYLEGWELFGRGVQAPAVAAQLTVVELRNPSASGVVAVVTQLIQGTALADTGAGLFYSRGPVTVDQNSIITNIGIDPRGRPACSCVMSANSAAPAAIPGEIQLGSLPLNANASFDWLQDQEEIPLLPGASLRISGGVVNQLVFSNWRWRERALEPSEAT